MTTKRCVVCGKEFPLRRRDQRQCGVACRVRAHRIRKGVGARRPRTQRERAEKVGHLFGVAATALAVAAVTRKLGQERAEREKAVAALEEERQKSAALRAENERQRAEFEVEKDRLRVEAEERQERLLKARDEEAQERQRVVLREERVTANNILGQVYGDVRDLRFERARAVDEKRIAEGKNAELLKERDELRGQLVEANKQCQRLLQAKDDVDQSLNQEMKAGRRLSELNRTLRGQLQQKTEQVKRLKDQTQEAHQHLTAGAESYEVLRSKYNALVGRFNDLLTTADETSETLRLRNNDMVGKYNTLLGAYKRERAAYNDLMGQYDAQLTAYSALGDRYNALATTSAQQYETLRLRFNTLVGEYKGLLEASSQPRFIEGTRSRQLAAENARLVSDRDWLIEQLTKQTEAVAYLQGVVRPQLQAPQSNKTRRALSADSTHEEAPRKNRSRRGSQKPRAAKTERIKLEAQEAQGSVWGSILGFCSAAAIGGGAAVLIQKLGPGGPSPKTLPKSSQPEVRRLPGRVGPEP